MIKLDQAKRIYFIGIKGVAMAALAIWAKESGKEVAGSDVEEEFPTEEELVAAGISIHTGFDDAHLLAFRPDLVIYTGAHGGKDNPQVVVSVKRHIQALPHGKALGAVMAGKRQISVAGSHGKTTTSAMIATILTQAGLDPSYAIGCGSIRGLGAAGHAGKGVWFVAEADEYVTDPGHDLTARFLWQKPEILVVTNIDFDHPDAYPNLAAVQQAFVTFQQKQVGQKLTVINADDPASSVLASGENVVTFGLSKKLSELKLQVAGAHNMHNAAAAVAVCDAIGISWEVIKRGLERFGGTKRRFEKLGELRGALIYDDYAHHPKEIEATIAAVRAWYPDRRLIVIFQPHTYSRTQVLLGDFAHALGMADEVLVTDIYASAREKKTDAVSGQSLAQETRQYNQKVRFAPDYDAVYSLLSQEIKRGDVIVFMGAGDIYLWGRRFVKELTN